MWTAKHTKSVLTVWVYSVTIVVMSQSRKTSQTPKPIHHLHVKLDVELFEKASTKAAKAGFPLSQIVRLLLKEYTESNQQRLMF
jgi:hypothetical protein